MSSQIDHFSVNHRYVCGGSQQHTESACRISFSWIKSLARPALLLAAVCRRRRRRGSPSICVKSGSDRQKESDINSWLLVAGDCRSHGIGQVAVCHLVDSVAEESYRLLVFSVLCPCLFPN